eukprot:PhM_4_TR10809/c0_g3_i1/m.60641/K13681/FUT; xyloglucan fucosyltransferase
MKKLWPVLFVSVVLVVIVTTQFHGIVMTYEKQNNNNNNKKGSVRTPPHHHPTRHIHHVNRTDTSRSTGRISPGMSTLLSSPRPHVPRSIDVDMSCDDSYVSEWYGMASDAEYCDKVVEAIYAQLDSTQATPPPPRFPVPNLHTTEDFKALLRRQRQLHELVASGQEPPDQKYLVWSLSGGVGNRVQSLVSTFMAAALSGRVFLMKDWFMQNKPRVSKAKRVKDLQYEELDVLLNESWRRNDELLCPVLPMMSLRDFAAKYPHYFKDSQYAEEHVKVDITARHDISNKRWERLLCNNLTDSFSHKFVYIWTNQYFLPLLFANPIHADQMKRMFPDDDAFGPLVRFVFVPHRSITQRAHTFVCKHFQGKRVTGLQVRSFRPTGMEQLAAAFGDCADALHKNTDVYFVASMHEPVRKTLNARYPGRIVVLDAARHQQFTGDVGHDREAISDMFILMHTDDFILSPGSTFGMVAAGYRSYLPVRTHPLRGGKAAPCSRMSSAQPCFGSWLSYDFISQKSQQGIYKCKAKPIPKPLDNCVNSHK